MVKVTLVLTLLTYTCLQLEAFNPVKSGVVHIMIQSYTDFIHGTKCLDISRFILLIY